MLGELEVICPHPKMRLQSHRPHLPVELIAYIIDYLDCPVALENCSRVCHAWLPLSRPHIFRVVRILLNGKGGFKCLQRLNNVLEQSPNISTYVSGLWLTIDHLPMPSSESLKLGTVLSSLLYKFTNVRKMGVSGIDWTNMTTPEIRSVVRALIDHPSLVHVGVYSSKFATLDHITALLPPTLKSLDIGECWGAGNSGVIDEFENKPSSPLKPCQLEYLQCDITSDIADWLLNSKGLDISNVRTLDVYSNRVDASESISRIVRRLGSSLEHLRITHSYAARRYGSIDVTRNPNIKSISLSGPQLTEALPCFKALMSSLVATNIEQIRFKSQFVGPYLSSIWEELDSILQGDQFTTLREVELGVLGIEADEALFRVVCRSLSICLPSLHARGILHFSPAQVL